jgi:SAM-dependent methyltransferase
VRPEEKRTERWVRNMGGGGAKTGGLPPMRARTTLGMLAAMSTTTPTTPTYVFDPTWQQEYARLRSIEDLFDPVSKRYLRTIGVRQGWRCLEVGCGAGGVAMWPADEVGPTGKVVATDLDTGFLEGRHGRANLEVRRHNLTQDPLEDATYDLVHARGGGACPRS